MLQTVDIEKLSGGRHEDPFAILGIHAVDAGLTAIRAFLPDAQSVVVLALESDRVLGTMKRVHSDGFFELVCDHDVLTPYRFDIRWTHGSASCLDDPYRFPNALQEMDIWLLGEGSHQRPFEVLGAHLMPMLGVDGVRFAVWAPNAKRVSVVGGFNNWDGRRHPMRLRRECGVWEIFLPGLQQGDLYKFEILGANGTLTLKADPYAFYAQMRPDTASVVYPLLPRCPMREDRMAANAFNKPMSIYEVHLGSWRKDEGWRWLSYLELAETLVPYARDMGFTHIELLPISEHPFDGSWGYQPLGLYAPTSRFGTPEDFRFFVDAAHDAGLGVILDWVPAHFPSDAHGLAEFDGTHLYEYADPKEGFHQDWNTLIYNFGRTEVRNFLVGNALYWLERFGVDGLRVDAVASMLFRDYSRAEGQWIPNRHGGRENLEAIEFLRRLNFIVGTERPGVITLAEESTTFPGVSRPPSQDMQSGGLGFHYKWNMGWMNDTLKYMSLDPVYRQHHQSQLTFGLMYAFTENFVLPLSHDEVVHGKGSLLTKMPGDAWQQFANLRALYGFMWAYPGKKLLFMGCELAQSDEWAAASSLPWHLQDQSSHKSVQTLVRDLNLVYRAHPALHQQDVQQGGFEWISHDDAGQSVIAFTRWSTSGQCAVIVCNFTPVPRVGYRMGMPQAGQWQAVINTDSDAYGGSGMLCGDLFAAACPAHGKSHSMTLDLPPLATLIFLPSGQHI